MSSEGAATVPWTRTPTSGATGSGRRIGLATGCGASRRSRLLAEHQEGVLFVAGCKSNQGKFYGQFDKVVLLSAPAEVILERIARRDDNPYGECAEERAFVLHDLATVEPLLRRTSSHELDAAAPVAAIADRLEAIAAER